MFNWIIGIPLLTLFASVWLAIAVIPSTRHEPSRFSLNILLGLIPLWAFCSIMFHSIPSPSTLFWLLCIIICATYTGATGVHFVIQFTEKTGAIAKWLVITFYILSIVLIISILSGKVVTEATLLPNGVVEANYGPLAPAMWGIIFLGMLIAVITLVLTLITPSRFDKKYIISALLGFIMICFGGLSNIFISSYPVDIAANFIFISLITYSVVGKHIIRPVNMQPLRLSLPVTGVMLTLCYLAMLTFCLKWLETTTGASHLIAAITVIIFGSITFGPSRMFLSNKLTQYFFPNIHRYQKPLSELANVDRSLSQWENNVSNILNLIAKATSADNAILLVRDSKAKDFGVKHAVGRSPASMLHIRLPVDSPLLKTLVESDNVLSTEEIDPTLYCGIQGYDGLLAIVALTCKSPHVWDQTEDKDFLKLACSQIAPLIINANLYQASLLEIEERKRMEEVLRESERKYRELADFLPQIVFETDERGNLIFSNRYGFQSFGYSSEDFDKGLNALQMLIPEERDRASENIQRILNGEEINGIECIALRKDGSTFPVIIYSTPIIYKNKPVGLRGIMIDITERKQLEEERTKYAKLESVGTLAGGIAHDFNNILTGIMGNIGLAMRHVEQKGKAEERLLEAEKASIRARDLTQQLLTFSRGGAPVKNIVSIAGLIKESVSFTLRGSNIRCDFDLPDNLWSVEADEGQINQVISNIIINVQEAMPEGGVININAGNTAVQDRSTLPLSKGRYVKIGILDHGVGIKKEHLDKIFDPYFTTKQKGSGLGLATSYSIIKNHGGYITVESKLGVGTTFHIYLPASKESVVAVEETKAEGVTRCEGRILVMDDEETIRELLHAELTEVGYNVELTSNGAEAIGQYIKARESGQPFDAVILDLTIPGGMGGKETIEKLLELDPDVKAIVSSGYATDPIMSGYKEYGFSAVMTKPYSVAQIEKALQSLLGKKK